MRRVINEFRRNMWEGFHEGPKVFRSSYKILPSFILKVPVIVVYLRILAVSKNNQKIHESIEMFGAEINKDQLIWLDEKNMQQFLKTTGRFEDIPTYIGDFLRSNFPSYESQIKDKISELQKNETVRIKGKLKDLVKSETATVKSLISDRINEIEARISRVTSLQTKITDFTIEESQQLEEDLRWLRKRKSELEEQLYSEPERIKAKLELSRDIRIFPLGVLYLLPENILKA
jgi:gas vesicle protein